MSNKSLGVALLVISLLVILSITLLPVYGNEADQFPGSTLNYNSIGEKPLNIIFDYDTLSLIVLLEEIQSGTLTLAIPRDVADSILPNGEDDEFFVFVDIDQVDYEEVKTATTRTLTISFPSYSNEIEILVTAIDIDIDTDGDTVSDDLDNCISTPNPNQSDINNDGVGDACSKIESFPGEPVLNFNTGDYYQYIHNPGIPWWDANLVDHQHSGVESHLATIHSHEENDLLTELIPTCGTAWIGLNDLYDEGNFVWSNGEPYDYSNWQENQPDNYFKFEHFTELIGCTGEWNDNTNWNGNNLGYFVEYDIPQTTAVEYNNDHYVVVYDSTISWTEAKTVAENSSYNTIPGQLVIIDNEDENDFIKQLITNDNDNTQAWIGLSDFRSEGNFKWNDKFFNSYYNWSNDPDNSGVNDFVTIDKDSGEWQVSENESDNIFGYIIEYDSLDINPDNGNSYEYIEAPGISWTDAKAAAESSIYKGVNGHLVTITSQSENTFVDEFIPDNSRIWIGLTDETTEGVYDWITGETSDYSNWDVNQPDDYTNEDYIEFLESSDKWNDISNDFDGIDGYIIEYDINT